MGMYIPKDVRMAILNYLFKEGIVVAEKEPQKKRHPAIYVEKEKEEGEKERVPIHNLYVLKLLKSLRSRGIVRERYCWRHYYWFLTNKGILVLREYLHLPAAVNPATLRDDREQRETVEQPGKGVEIDEEDLGSRRRQPMGRGYRHD